MLIFILCSPVFAEHPENGKANKPEENVRLYDAIIQVCDGCAILFELFLRSMYITVVVETWVIKNLEAMSDLPGVTGQSDLETPITVERLVCVAERYIRAFKGNLTLSW